MHDSLIEIKKFYREISARLQKVREKIKKPLTLTEKILYGHASKSEAGQLYVDFDHIAMHDGAAQMILLQFALSGKRIPSIPTSVHCDHMIIADQGIKEDLTKAHEENGEIYEFLQVASSKSGVGFWKPGSGIMHQQLLESVAFPGGLLMATDPHISFVGGMGMLAIGGNGIDVLDAMIGVPYRMAMPRIIGVKLTGRLHNWASSKDLILKLVPVLIAKGAKGAILEFFGEGAETLSSTAKGTICSMASEVEAVGALFHYDHSMKDYLTAVGRLEVAELVAPLFQHLQADEEVLQDPFAFYDVFLEIDLSTVEPCISGPSTLHRVMALADFSAAIRQQEYPEALSLGLIGSCTNSSYEDIKNAALIARQALKHGLRVKVPLLISPGSQRIKETLIHEGLWKILEDIGATFLTSSCGPCIGQWKRYDLPFGERNSIVTAYNSSNSGHHDNNPNTDVFVASPEIVMALALAGTLTFNPQSEMIMTPQGLPLQLLASQTNNEYPTVFSAEGGYISPSEDGSSIRLPVDPLSERLQLLDPLYTLAGNNFFDLRLLVKVGGKCTSDQISPAGKWLRYRAHLDTLSNNLFSLAPNRFREEVGKGKNLLTGSIEPFAKIAREYKREGIGWIAVAYENCGEGPCREHAAMSIRHLGCQAIIANSFFPFFEMHLKKQGLLALTFTHPVDCDKIREDDWIDLLGVEDLAVNSSLELLLKHADGTTDRLSLTHSYTQEEIAWFKGGSILNVV